MFISVKGRGSLFFFDFFIDIILQGVVMKKILSKMWKYPFFAYLFLLGFFFLSFMCLDLGIRYFSNQYTAFYGWTHASPFFFSLSWVFLFFFFLMLLPKKGRLIIYSILIGFFNILVLAQMLHQSILGRFFHVYDLFLTGEGAGYFLSSFQWITPYMVGLLFVSIISYICGCFLISTEPSWKHTMPYYTRLSICLLASFLLFRGLAFERLGEPSAANSWDRWNNVHDVYVDFNNPSKNMEVAGLYEMTFRSVVVYVEQEYFEDTSALKEEVDHYFTVRNETLDLSSNEYTGLLKGKNLILIMLESIDSWLVNEEVMPTLSYLQQTGWNFTERYSPAFGGGQTFNSEFAVNTGLFAIQNGQAAYNFDHNAYPYSLPSLFRNSGYQTQALHVNHGNFYNRNSIHLAMGYDRHISLVDDFQSSNLNFFYDSNLLKDEGVANLIIPDEEPFMNFIITYAAHMPYDVTNNMCATDLYGLTVSGNSTLSCIRNLAHDTDEFLKALLERLEKENHLDDTVLILFSDHYAYAYPDPSYIATVKGESNGNLLQHVPFIIWSKDIKSQTFDTLMTTTDILPTIANLFDLEGYNPKNYIATDVLGNNHDNFVYFADGSWYDGSLYYTGQEIRDDMLSYVSSVSQKVQDKITTNDNILLSNYYADS